MRQALTLLCVTLPLGMAACTSTTEEPLQSERAELAASHCWQATLSWGPGAGELGFIPRAYERVARGPAAIAVGPTGEVFALDSVNGRVLGITQDTTRVAIDKVPTDAEDLAIGNDGALAVHSPLQAKAWVFDPDGAPAGSLDIARTFRGIVGIDVDASRQVSLRNAYQETFSAGSPAAPKDLPTMLSQKREGAFQLEDGRGVAVRAKDGVAELLLIRNATPETHSQISQAYAIPGEVTGAQLVGMTGDIACLRLEQVTQPGEVIRVQRRALCMNVQTGAIVQDRTMPTPKTYKPRHELAVGANALAALEPHADGMTINVCEVAR